MELTEEMIQNLKGKGFDKHPDHINKSGRPPKLPGLDQLLEETLGKETNNVSAMQLIIEALIKKAQKGDVRAAELLINRKYGLQKKTLDLELNLERLCETDLDIIINRLLNEQKDKN